LAEGLSWQIAGKLTEAEKAYRDAIRLAPGSPDIHNNLAFVLFDLRRHSEALQHWEETVRLKSDDADALAGQGIGLEALGHHSAALEAYRSAVAKDERFLDCKVLQEEFVWSEAACKAAQPLIDELRRTR
jgi:Flp pilus assembly protein TadD